MLKSLQTTKVNSYMNLAHYIKFYNNNHNNNKSLFIFISTGQLSKSKRLFRWPMA